MEQSREVPPTAVDPNSHLSLAGVSRFYGKTVALRRVSLAVAAGETLFLTGNNGAGKSTLLAVIAGVFRPDEGTVCYRTADLKSASAMRRRQETRYVPAGIGLYADLTVEENVRLWAAACGGECSGVDSERILTQLRIDRFRSKRVRECSTGVARRATLACGFLGSPRLLVLDEPLAHLDSSSQEAVCALLAEEQARGTTLVIAAHESDFVARLGSRALALEDGTLRGETSLRASFGEGR